MPAYRIALAAYVRAKALYPHCEAQTRTLPLDQKGSNHDSDFRQCSRAPGSDATGARRHRPRNHEGIENWTRKNL